MVFFDGGLSWNKTEWSLNVCEDPPAVSRWVFWRWKKQKAKLIRWWFLFALQFAVLVIWIEDPNWLEKTNTCIDWNHQPHDVHNIYTVYMCKYVYIYICTGLADNLNLRDKTWLLLEDPVIFPVKIPAVFELEVLAKTTDFIGKKVDVIVFKVLGSTKKHVDLKQLEWGSEQPGGTNRQMMVCTVTKHCKYVNRPTQGAINWG